MNLPKLRFFLDTANVDAWKIWLPTGLFYGVTTNPLLLERADAPCTVESLKSVADIAFNLGAQNVQLQTWGTTVEKMVSTGKALAAVSNRITVKVPLTQVGIQATRELRCAKISITLTACYAHHQVIIADAASADYVAPYLGRMNDLEMDGRKEISNMQRSLSALHSRTRILVASIRSVDDITALTMNGLDTFTFSPAIAQALFDVPPTQKAAADFQRAAQAMQK
ncbi:MAG: transaldolase family protein [Cyanobacteria bacterium P01_F01_bin.150]